MSHIPVLLEETVSALLATRHHGIFVDATFGRGGHTRAVLAALDDSSRVFAFDKDPHALAVGQQLMQEDSRFNIIHASFAEMQQQLKQYDVDSVDGIMADLGVSSPQLDHAERGFSFMADGPLDMRMNNLDGQTAAEWLVEVDEQHLADVLYQYGEERYSRRIAKAIKHAGVIETTLQLAEIVKAAHPKWEKHKHPATRTFQAIRIKINRELDDLEQLLAQSIALLKPEARLAVISFHSLEDRIVKQFISRHAKMAYNEIGLPVNAQSICLKAVARIRAGEQEVNTNPRARSAWLRVAERLPHA